MKTEAKAKKKRRSKYTEEFKAGAVRLVGEGRSPVAVAQDLGVHSSSVYNWVGQAAVDAGEGPASALSTDEKVELAALRKENRVLKLERDILKKSHGLLRQGERVKFAFIEAEKANAPIEVLCEVLGVSRSGFYASRTRAESAHAKDDRRLRVLCTEAHERSRRNYGSVRVHKALKKQGVFVSRKRVCRLMKLEGIAGKRRRRWTRTTESVVGSPTALNLLNRDFSPEQPNQCWAGDVTFLRTPYGFVYLAVIIDLFSRYVVGWSVSAVNDASLVQAALRGALQRRCPPRGLLHHSDQGSTYTSENYQQMLDANGIVCSMSRRGNCYDNAVVESFFGTFKTELAEDFESAGDVKRQAFDYIEIFYNQQRMHSTLGHLSPAEYEQAARMSRAA